MYEAASKYLIGYEPRRLTQDQLDEIRDRIYHERQRNGIRNMLNNLRMIVRKIYGRKRLKLTVPAYKAANKEALELEELQRFKKVVDREGDPMQTAIVALLIGCLDRPIEIVKLNEDHVDLESMELQIWLGKTGNRITNIPDFTAAALREWKAVRQPCPDPKDPKALFWSKRTKKRITKAYIHHHLRALRLKAGIKRHVNPKLFRDTGITHLLNLGVNPKIVQQHAGHRNFATTMIYNSPTKGDHRRLIRNAYGRLLKEGGKTKQEVFDDLIERYQHGDVKLEELQAVMSLGVTRTGDVGALKVLEGLLHIQGEKRATKRPKVPSEALPKPALDPPRFNLHVKGRTSRTIRGLSKDQARELQEIFEAQGDRAVIKRGRLATRAD